MTRLNEQGQVIATGTWMVSGVKFECTYTHNSDGQVHRLEDCILISMARSQAPGVIAQARPMEAQLI